MKNRLIFFILIITSHLLAIGFIMNSLYEWTAALVSMAYIISITVFLHYCKYDWIAALSSFLFVCLVFGFAFFAFHNRNNINSLVSWLLPVFMFISPFSGLAYFTFIPQRLISCIPLFISALWLILCTKNLRFTYRQLDK